MVLRGTNKKIIEIISTNSDYFEKVIFFVKNDKDVVNEHFLKKKAMDYTKQYETVDILNPKKDKKKTNLIYSLAKYAGVAGIGATIASILTKI